MGRMALLLCAAFFLGLGAGLYLAFRPTRSGQQITVSSQAGTAPEPAAPAPAIGPRQDREGPTSATPLPASDRSLLDLVRSTPVPAMERGQGTITGRVHDESDGPVPGVLIRATRLLSPEEKKKMSGGHQKRGSDEPSLEEKVRELIAEERWSAANRSETRSGADGSFTLSGIADATYSIEPRLEGYQWEWSGEAKPGGEPLDILAIAILRVQVAVLLPDGSPSVHATIVSRTAHREETREWTPHEPQVLLKAGTYRLSASQGEPEELASSVEEVTLEKGSVLPQVTLQLKGRPGIRGKLIFQEGDEFRLGEVRLMRVNPAHAPDLRKLASWGRSGETEEAYHFPDLSPGTYLLGASRGEGRIVASELVQVSDRMVTRDLQLPPPSPADYFVLRVFGPKGEVLTKVDISTEVRSRNGGSSSGSARAVNRKDGSFLVLHREGIESEDPETLNAVTIKSERYPEKRVEYRRTETSEINVQLSEPASLEVSLEGNQAGGLEGSIHLRIEKERLEDPGQEVGRSRGRSHHEDHEDHELDGQGSALFESLEPGSYRLNASYGSGAGEFPLLAQSLAVGPGPNRVTLLLPRLFFLNVSVQGAVRNSNLQLAPAVDAGQDSWTIHQQIGKDGLAFFDGLPEGTYKVTYHGGDEPMEMRVSVPAQSEVQFQPRKFNAVQVKAEDPQGALAKAGLLTGDLIVGVNGEGFESRQEWKRLLGRLSGENEVRLLVQRGNFTLEVPVSPKKIRGEKGLEPASR